MLCVHVVFKAVMINMYVYIHVVLLERVSHMYMHLYFLSLPLPPFLPQDTKEDSCTSSLDLPIINLPLTPRQPLSGNNVHAHVVHPESP